MLITDFRDAKCDSFESTRRLEPIVIVHTHSEDESRCGPVVRANSSSTPDKTHTNELEGSWVRVSSAQAMPIWRGLKTWKQMLSVHGGGTLQYGRSACLSERMLFRQLILRGTCQDCDANGNERQVGPKPHRSHKYRPRLECLRACKSKSQRHELPHVASTRTDFSQSLCKKWKCMARAWTCPFPANVEGTVAWCMNPR